MNKHGKKPLDYDDIQREHGGLGPYEILLTILAGLCLGYGAANALSTNYLAPPIQHRCRIPELEGKLPDADIQKLAIPYDDSKGSYSSCKMYNVTWTDHLEEGVDLIDLNVSGIIVPCQEGWWFDHSVFELTLIEEWELVCDRTLLFDCIAPIYLAGMMVGSLVCGQISNRFGRRRSLVIFALSLLVSGIASALSPNIIVYLSFRFLMGACMVSCSIAGSIVLLEILSPHYRDFLMGVYQTFYAIGVLILCTFGYFIRKFRHLQIAISLIAIPVISYLWILPESPRWLMWMGRSEQANKEMQKIFRRNRKKVPQLAIDEYTNKEVKTDEPTVTNPDQGTAMDFLRHPVARKYIICIGIIWAAGNFTFMGISMNITELFGDPFMNGILAAATEGPIILIGAYTMLKFGRRRTIIGVLIVMVLCAFIPMPFQIMGIAPMVSTVCALVCRSCASAMFASLYMITGEVYTTPLRQSAIGIGNACSFTFSLVAPFICGPSMVEIWVCIPNLSYGGLSFLALVLTLMLPETMGSNLPETLQDMENLDKQPRWGNLKRPKSNAKSDEESQSRNMEEIPDVCKISNGKSNEGFEWDEVLSQSAPYTINTIYPNDLPSEMGWGAGDKNNILKRDLEKRPILPTYDAVLISNTGSESDLFDSVITKL